MALQLPSGPINYGVDIPDPSQSFLQAFKTGTAITETRMAQEQAQRQAEQQQQITQAFQRLRQPGATAKDYADLAMLLPETQAKAVRESFNMITADQQQSTLNQAGQVFSAFKSGKPEIAVGLIERQIEAKRNSGDEGGARFLETWRDVAKENPKAAEDYFGFTISQIPGGDKVIAGVVQLAEERRKAEKAPFELTEAQAKAQSAAVSAKFAESNAVLDLQKKGWDITKIQEDIKIAKQNAGIAALNAQISREGNDLRRRELQLKVQEMEQKRDEAVRGKVAEASTAAAQADNLLNTVEKALNMSVTGRDKAGKPTGFTGTITSATGPISSRMPTLSQDVADFEETINTLGSQITMSRIGEMKGALSDKDLATLQSSLQSLSLRQSPQQLVNNLLEVQRLTQKARKNTMDKFGAPATLSVPDTPAAQPSPAEIDDLVKKYGGGR